MTEKPLESEQSAPVANENPTSVEQNPVTPDPANPESYGRVDETGTVWVLDTAGERTVGQYADGVPDDPLALYVRRFLDLQAQIALFETRLPILTARDIDQTLASLTTAVIEPAAVGHLEGLRQRVARLQTAAEERKEAARAERLRAKEEALELRTAIILEAEEIAGQDPERTQWKNSGARLRELLEEWKGAQRRGPRLDRADEDSLWRRFSSARTNFDRHRRQFFSRLDAAQSEAKRAKEQLIAEAERLAGSEEWGPTAGAYRELMDRWRVAGRASRKDDDALWERFRAAQQTFFDARRAQNAALDADYQRNLEVKEELLAEAEALLPITDIEATKTALRRIQDAWETAGRVPRADVARIERRMRTVEQALRDAEDTEWRRTDPETVARAEGMAGQLRTQIADLERKLAKAREAGNDRRVKELEDSLSTRKAWLDQVTNFGG